MTNTIGQFIRMKREKKELSQTDISKRLKCHHQFISNWERGVSNPPPSMWNTLCKVLDIEKDELKRELLKRDKQKYEEILR